MNASRCEALLADIDSRAARKIELDLERLPALLERLDRPHHHLPPVIHIAGTNGKGSTLAFLKAMLSHAGRRVQAFTSPYLQRVTEEVTLSGGEIEDAHLGRLLERVDDASDGIHPTSFEALTAAAFLAFREDDADVLLLETAMGGRLDVTNVVPSPALTIITPIAMDHMAFLGDTITAIATEKAGILKPGTPCVANPQHPDAVQVIRDRAASLGNVLRLAGEDFVVDPDNGRFAGNETFNLPALSLPGPHQWDNAALAVAAMEVFAPDLLPDAVAGLSRTEWPARMQRLTDKDREIWVDGGHNPHAAGAMAAAISAMPPKRLAMIVAMLDNRPLDEFLEPFRSLDPLVIGVPLPSRPVYAVGNPMTPQSIAAVAGKAGFRSSTAESVQQALDHLSGPTADARVLVTGSLYLAGAVLPVR
ncbi:bifunctional folylpolyglutamate synthase/dihydrofolate synthase [Minwuia sp.]|uniref:bifunctional folylpolyglutamate synthase/dihydrofolate synthase n=1 Tax=Minwuia sp. TaxID=2493630 RepID=UPI003A9573C1